MSLPPEYEELRAALVRYLRGDEDRKPMSPEHACDVAVSDTFEAFEAASASRDLDTLRAILDTAVETCRQARLDVTRDALAGTVVAEAEARGWPDPDGWQPLPPHEFINGGDAIHEGSTTLDHEAHAAGAASATHSPKLDRGG